LAEHTAADAIAAYDLGGHGKLRRVGTEHKGPCPICGGDDRFHIGERSGTLLLHCRHGCEFLDLLKSLFPAEREDTWEPDRTAAAESLPEPDPEPEPYGCTLAQLAERTRLPLDFLRSLEWEDATCYVQQADGEVPAVRIPYYALDTEKGRHVSCIKFRVRVSGADKYRFGQGYGARIYGESELSEARKHGKLIVVEGETDAATLWHHGLPAIGIPGTGACAALESHHLDGVARVYVVAEQDEAGEKFPGRVAERMRAIGVTLPVLVVRLDAQDTNDLHVADPLTFRARFLEAHRLARGLRESKIPADKFVTMRQVMRATYADTDWVIRGLLPVGMAVLASSPKVGKSSIAYQFAAGVALGARVAGTWDAERGEVLYLDLEQKIGKRTQDRAAIVGAEQDRDQWTVIDEWPSLDKGGLEELDIWLEEHPACRLVVVDVISRIMPRQLKGNIYHAEYDIFARLKRVGDEHAVCVLAVHHDNKSRAEDGLDAISGSRAITGAANSILWLTRTHGEADGKLHVMGRDVIEEKLAGRFEARLWTFWPGAHDGP